MKLIKILSFLLLFSGMNFLQAQPVDGHFAEDVVFVFRYDATSPDHPNNYFVKQLARYNYLNLYTTKYSLGYSLELSIANAENNRISAAVKMNPKNMDGDIYYQNLDLSEVLLPSGFILNLIVKSRDAIRQHTFSDLKIGDNNIVDFSWEENTTLDELEIEIAGIDFYYTETDKEQFHERIEAINQFLAYARLLDFNYEKALTVNPEDTSLLLPNFFKIYDLERFATMLDGHEINFVLPEEIQKNQEEKSRKIHALLRRLKTLYKQNADTLNPAITETDFSRAAQTLIGVQLDYIALMRESNHLYEPVFLSVVRIFATPAEWLVCEEALTQQLLLKANIQFPQPALRQLSRTLYSAFNREADTLIVREKFNEAEIVAETATTFCAAYPDTDCELSTFHKMARIKYGLFDAYLRIVVSAIQNNKPDYATQYLVLAREYQQTNSSFIITAEAVDNLYEEVAWNYLQNAKSYFDEENFDEAANYYHNARELYVGVNRDTYLELIDQQIAKCLTN